LPNGFIAVFVHVVRQERREAVPLLALPAEGASDEIEMCSFCKNVRLRDDMWVTAEEAVAELDIFGEVDRHIVVHSVCPACAADLGRTRGPRFCLTADLFGACSVARCRV